MAIVGIQTNRDNPDFAMTDFEFWMPQFTNFLETTEGETMYTKIYTMVNQKVYFSIFGTDWELAMSYAIAHYMTLIAQQQQAPSGNTLADIAGGGTTKGVLNSMTVGSFSKGYDIDKTMSSDTEAMFWNQTSYGSSFWSLLKSKPIASMLVITSNPVPGAN